MNRDFLSLVMLLLAWVGSGSSFALQAGSAKQEITPPIGAPLNGYGYRMGRGAVEVHDPLWARAVYLEDDDTALFLVSVDLCVINRELRDRVVKLMPAIVPADHVILTATHNHSGTGGMSKSLVARAISGPFRPDLIELTAQGIVQAMTAAHDARVRATVGYGVTTQDVLTKNRRVEGGPVDAQLGVIRVDDSDGQSIALMANLAAHPTTVGEEFAFAISADFPGYFYTAMEGMANEGCVAMLLNGAEGNQMCANPENATGWAHTESIGRLLAVRAKGLANEIVGTEANLTLSVSSPRLPQSIASPLFPESTFLQTLEIDGLVLNFVPGEPCVEIGLELRRRALAFGYAAQLTVGLANDHLMYFAPREYYGLPYYESGMNFYGPRMTEWFLAEFTKLMARAPKVKPARMPEPPEIEKFAGGTRVRLSGNFYRIGYQRGLAFKEAIRAAYQERVVARVQDGSLVSKTGLWAIAPDLIDHTGLALPRLAIGSRALLAGLDPSIIDELSGMADAAELPFDALWLLQCQPEFLAADRLDDLYRAPFCTMLAVTGDRAGAERILVARTLDWAVPEQPVVIQTQPDDGHAYTQVGFAWNTGVFTGMNELGLVVCAERMRAAGTPSFAAPSIEFVLRECLLREAAAEGAAARIAGFPSLSGYHVLLADAAENAIVLELGTVANSRIAEDGLLMGAKPESEHVDSEAVRRYSRARELLADAETVSIEELERILEDAEPGARGRERILNEDTRHAVVFAPAQGTISISFPLEDGTLGAFEIAHVDREVR